jgi:hypothetical protein
LFDLEGQVVARGAPAGRRGSIVEIVLDLRGIAPGVYLAQLELSTGGRRTGRSPSSVESGGRARCPASAWTPARRLD